MSWEMFYLICFGVGLALTALALAGGFHRSLHFGAHPVSHAGHAHMVGQRGMHPLNGFTVTAFLCWFGGAGFLLQQYAGFVMPVVVLLATLSGVAGGALILLFLNKVIAPHDRSLTVEDTEMTGVLSRVSGTIRSEGTGEIIYSQNGARRASPARSDGGEPIARDTEVVVMRYERGIAYVRRWDEISSETTLPPDEGERQA